jgi:hypothetical protein
MQGWLFRMASRFNDFVLAENLTGLLSQESRLYFFALLDFVRMSTQLQRQGTTARRNKEEATVGDLLLAP